MSSQPNKALKATAVFLVFAFAQVYVQIGFAEPAATTASMVLPQNIIVARLVTSNNQAITVNGASAVTGATILTGANIQTPADVGATINLGPLGTVDLAPNTTIKLDFDEDGNIKVTLIAGCVIVNATKKTEGEILTPQGESAGKTDKGAGGVLEGCFPPGATAPNVGQGVAAGSGAGAGAAAAADTVAAGGGIGTAATIAIIGGIGATVIGIGVTRGDNPSVVIP